MGGGCLLGHVWLMKGEMAMMRPGALLGWVVPGPVRAKGRGAGSWGSSA